MLLRQSSQNKAREAQARVVMVVLADRGPVLREAQTERPPEEALKGKVRELMERAAPPRVAAQKQKGREPEVNLGVVTARRRLNLRGLTLLR